MNNLLDMLIKGDVLKAAYSLLRASNLNAGEKYEPTPISVSLLILVAVFLSLAKVFYGAAGFTLPQHFAATFALIFVFYISGGMTVMFFRASYETVNHWASSIIACVLATSLIAIALLLTVGSVTPWTASAINEFFNINFENIPSFLEGLLLVFEDASSAIFYSFVGCFVVFWVNQNAEQENEYIPVRRRLYKVARNFSVCWIVTSLVVYTVAMERNGFFDNVMTQIAKAKVFQSDKSEK